MAMQLMLLNKMQSQVSLNKLMGMLIIVMLNIWI